MQGNTVLKFSQSLVPTAANPALFYQRALNNTRAVYMWEIIENAKNSGSPNINPVSQP